MDQNTLPNLTQNNNGSRTILSKTDKTRSSPFFQTTRVESCSYVSKGKGGNYRAVPFRISTKKSYASLMTPSSEVVSLSRYIPLNSEHLLDWIWVPKGSCFLEESELILNEKVFFWVAPLTLFEVGFVSWYERVKKGQSDLHPKARHAFGDEEQATSSLRSKFIQKQTPNSRSQKTRE